jgi:hypothetical protein
MNQSLKTFKSEYQDLLLNFLWRQWSALGVAGHARGGDSWAIDPEALLLVTCTLGRHEPRLFDEVLDWLQENGWLINILRLKRILRKEEFDGARVLAAMAGLMSKGADVTKWKQLAEPVGPLSMQETFFFAEHGEPLPVVGEPDPHFLRYGFTRGPIRARGYSQKFRPTDSTNLALQLRALVGVNSRAEVLLYLLTHDAAHPSQIAREAYYYDRAIQNTLVELSQSGVVELRSSGREKHYWLKSDNWATLLNRPERFPKWITWPPLFSALERIWLKLNDPQLAGLSPLLQSSELRQIMVQVRPSFEQARFDKTLSDDRQYLGEKYLPVFLADITNILG